LCNIVGDWANHRKNEDITYLEGIGLIKNKEEGTQNMKQRQVKEIFN
jgi:hypothetical protein